MNGATTVSLDRGLIVAKTTHPYDTRRCPSKTMTLTNGQIVKLKVLVRDPLILFDDVVIRVSPHFATYMPLLIMMKQNACGLSKGVHGTSLSKRRLDNESF